MQNTEKIDSLFYEFEKACIEKGVDPITSLKGATISKPINYWEYIHLDTLLSLQKPKTNFQDEYIFIVYHQITELVLRLIVHELEQLTYDGFTQYELISDKLNRMIRYTDMLITSFSVMNKGMSYEDYNTFRLALAPASGFQSAQFRIIELYCTDVDNLIQSHKKQSDFDALSMANKFELIYWQDAGKDYQTRKKSLTLKQFEEKYLHSFLQLAENLKFSNLSRKYKKWAEMEILNETMVNDFKRFDRKFNIDWPMVHLVTAHTYLGSGKEEKAATGGSHWEKYLHPKYQKRIFFPELLTIEEKEKWGN